MSDIKNYYDDAPPFSPEALVQAKSALRLRLASFSSKRADLRGKTAFTFSDNGESGCVRAFSLYRGGTSWRLGVHIADVAEYVCLGSPLEQAARSRCALTITQSGYAPMLPPEITEDVCSLAEGKDRLSLSLFMDIDRDGKLTGFSFDESIVRVARQCVYRETDELLTNSDTSATMFLREKYAFLLPTLTDMFELAGLLYKKRIAAGGLDYTPVKRVYTHDPEQKINGSSLLWEHDTETMVREINFFASAAVGKFMRDNTLPCLYIGQDALPERTIDWMSRFLGIENDKTLTGARRTTLISEASKGTPFFEHISEAVSALLPHPVYSEKPVFNAYAATDTAVTFSRPTERYPDLLAQYILKEAVAASGHAGNLNLNRYRREVRSYAKTASAAEKTAYEANLNASQQLAAEFIGNSGKQTFSGIPIFIEPDGTVRVILLDGLYAVMETKGRNVSLSDNGITVDGEFIELYKSRDFRIVRLLPGIGECTLDI